MDEKEARISEALENLAMSLAESGAVPIPEILRALERAAERLRNRAQPTAAPDDLITQAEASRTIGVSRQAVNQWVQKGVVSSYIATDQPGRHSPRVSLSEVAIAANRRPPAQFSTTRRRELLQFLSLLPDVPTDGIVVKLMAFLEDESPSAPYPAESRVLREFLMAAMDSGDRQREFTAEGLRLLSDLPPKFQLDRQSNFGRIAESLGMLVVSSNGTSGFDSPVTVMLAITGAATVGTRFASDDSSVSQVLARKARQVWGDEWLTHLQDATFHLGKQRPSPLTRYTASLAYLDNNRFLRQAQSAGVSVSYVRGPGVILPQRLYGGPIYHDILHGRRVGEPIWSFTDHAAQAVGRPVENPSAMNPFRLFNYEFGLMDASIHGIRRYAYSAADARSEFLTTIKSLSRHEAEIYRRTALDGLARTLALPHIELVSIDASEDFDWWKDHIVRSSEREILIGLRDEEARNVAHGILVQTSMLPDVIEAADTDASLRERLRLYVKNLEFDLINARYSDDLRRGVGRVIKAGGRSLTAPESRELAEAEFARLLG